MFDVAPRGIGGKPPEAAGGPEMTEEALLEGLRAGTLEAYEVLMERFEAPLYRFFYYSHGHHDLAQDQCGETFINLLSAIQKMRGDAGCLKAFIFGVARNVLRRGWRQRRLYSASEAMLARLSDARPSAYRLAASRQEYQRAMAAIEELTEPARQVFLLRFVEELSLAEISEALDLPLGTVKSYIHRSRKRLLEMLRE